jgi:hypothetical protein
VALNVQAFLGLTRRGGGLRPLWASAMKHEGRGGGEDAVALDPALNIGALPFWHTTSVKVVDGEAGA